MAWSSNNEAYGSREDRIRDREDSIRSLEEDLHRLKYSGRGDTSFSVAADQDAILCLKREIEDLKRQ